MRMSILLAAAAASSLIASPALASSASPLSLANASGIKATTSAKKSSKLAGDGLMVAIVALGIGGLVVAAAVDNSDSN